MNKDLFVSDVSGPVRLFAIAAMLAVALICGACFLIVTGVVIVAIDQAPPGPVIGTIGLFGFLTFASGWISIRLLRKQRAANGRTVMPVWFIQLFGIVFLIAFIITAIVLRQIWLLGGGIGIALTMIGIRSLLRQPISSQTKANNRLNPRGGSGVF